MTDHKTEPPGPSSPLMEAFRVRAGETVQARDTHVLILLVDASDIEEEHPEMAERMRRAVTAYEAVRLPPDTAAPWALVGERVLGVLYDARSTVLRMRRLQGLRDDEAASLAGLEAEIDRWEAKEAALGERPQEPVRTFEELADVALPLLETVETLAKTKASNLHAQIYARVPMWSAMRAMRAFLDSAPAARIHVDGEDVTDTFHPAGECSCAGEGSCTWCLMDSWRERAKDAETNLAVTEGILAVAEANWKACISALNQVMGRPPGDLGDGWSDASEVVEHYRSERDAAVARAKGFENLWQDAQRRAEKAYIAWCVLTDRVEEVEAERDEAEGAYEIGRGVGERRGMIAGKRRAEAVVEAARMLAKTVDLARRLGDDPNLGFTVGESVWAPIVEALARYDKD